MLSSKLAFKQLLLFALPIIAGHLGIVLIGTGDMVIAGHYSSECLAAIGLAVAIANPIMISLLGLQFSISPVLAQKRGRGEDISEYFFSVLLYTFFVSLISCILTYVSSYFVSYFGYSENVTRIIIDYLRITSFSAFGLCLYQGLKEYLQSQEKTLASNLIAIIAVGVNLFMNYGLVFGKFGLPQLHEVGLAWASFGVRAFMALGLFLLTIKLLKKKLVIKWDFIKEVFTLGTPIAFTLFFEIMAFCSVTLFVGKFGEIQSAANNIALNIGSLAFMVPMSIGAAVSVKIGHAYGERNFPLIRIFSKVALLFALAFAVLTCLVFSFLPDTLVALFTSDQQVLEWGSRLLFYVACFQFFDGAQVTQAGILRGLNITRAASIAVFIGYWIIGIPIGYYLGFIQNFEAIGFWQGLTISLAVVAVMLGLVLKKALKNVQQESSHVPSM
ncbi:MAG: MATE family efflux transporter [Candidatus Caldatribacteriota bacterium]